MDSKSHSRFNRDVDLPTQRNFRTGCIPTGFEWLLQHHPRASEIRFASFQEDFDLKMSGRGENGFLTIAAEISRAYPFISIVVTPFKSERERFAWITRMDLQVSPILISVAQVDGAGNCSFHIMPLLEVIEDEYRCAYYTPAGGQPHIATYSIAALEALRDRYQEFGEGGLDIATFES